ncbi:ATP-binding cassette domain-containing protein [Solidesulfovibrio sp.]|uniref:ATP-binding cassette domain-containing protein n=1 Tax=Solidesulfovibrio sp. TaxID=2910990 RepID=UPI002B211E97|nr:ATP-binding cassette domain-containing protein [Solidesulfovibrio sp.]MEA4855390.1 ATP-binding cassette domain-containing protein [Solidesulfovibrio sp.]
MLAVLGPSGIGKSTLLRLAARLSRPTSGTVMLAVRRIGFVFQEPRLLPWRTALENVALPLLAMGVPLEQARTRAAAMLGRMGLAAFATSCPETLSGGMRQRVSLARAFVVEPELLLLDEPFTGLDPELRLSMRRHLDALLAASGAASLHVTHDIGDIPVRTNRILRLTAAGVRFERPCDLGMTVLKEAL